MYITKEQTYGYIGSVLFGAVLLLFLFFSVLRTIRTTDEAGGILVNFGTVDEASGLNEPSGKVPVIPNEQPLLKPQPTIQPVKEPTAVSLSSPKSTITQDTEETLALATENKKEVERKAVEEYQRQAIQHQVADAFGTGSTLGGSEGSGSGIGNQGSLQGNAATGSYSGVGGYGNFSLNGRSLGKDGLPRPGYAVQEEGIIVVDITVNPQGAVIYAVIGKGTTIDHPEMRRSALDAAKKAQFNSISGMNDQSGKITYRYRLK
jgi:TonB family protein